MTPRENLLRALRRQGFETVPVDCNAFCPSQREAFRKRFGHDDVEGYFNSYWGTIGTQRLLPFGTPDEVRAAVRRNLDICGASGGIVIGPTHMVEPEVPWENLEAMRLAALS